MSEDAKDLMRKLVMIVSETRQQETERYENHVKFMNQITEKVEAFTNVMNERWKWIEDKLHKLTENLQTSLSKIN